LGHPVVQTSHYSEGCRGGGEGTPGKDKPWSCKGKRSKKEGEPLKKKKKKKGGGKRSEEGKKETPKEKKNNKKGEERGVEYGGEDTLGDLTREK